MANGWSVRELEARARTAGDESGFPATEKRPARSKGRGGVHPDQAEAIERIGDALSAALGADVHVRGAASGYTAQLSFASIDEALEFAAQFGQ